ncbi:MCE family protein, partial [bacterium]|nr:MCE family protein [bacterium]
RRRHRSSQLIWIVPIIALIIGMSLAIKSYLEKGPVITISFKSGEGIEAGKTKIKYKDVQIGLVRTVTIAKDRSKVLITADIANSYNRDVFAIPGRIGDPFSEGSNFLIRTNRAA